MPSMCECMWVKHVISNHMYSPKKINVLRNNILFYLFLFFKRKVWAQTALHTIWSACVTSQTGRSQHSWRLLLSVRGGGRTLNWTLSRGSGVTTVSINFLATLQNNFLQLNFSSLASIETVSIVFICPLLWGSHHPPFKGWSPRG